MRNIRYIYMEGIPIMERYTEPAKEIPVYGRYDVVVSGGGCAGFAAAVASAVRALKP